LAAIAERAVLQVLDGSCHTPVGAYAVVNDGRMTLKCAVAMPDGSIYLDDEVEGPVATIQDAQTLGQFLGHRIKPRIPEGIL
jgi:hydroxymethylbilane synthase